MRTFQEIKSRSSLKRFSASNTCPPISRTQWIIRPHVSSWTARGNPLPPSVRWTTGEMLILDIAEEVWRIALLRDRSALQVSWVSRRLPDLRNERVRLPADLSAPGDSLVRLPLAAWRPAIDCTMCPPRLQGGMQETSPRERGRPGLKRQEMTGVSSGKRCFRFPLVRWADRLASIVRLPWTADGEPWQGSTTRVRSLFGRSPRARVRTAQPLSSAGLCALGQKNRCISCAQLRLLSTRFTRLVTQIIEHMYANIKMYC
jgi:hypothetical protein